MTRMIVNQSNKGTMNKIIQQKSLDFRIRKFLEGKNLEDRYAIKELSRWHTLMTLSCPTGKKEFAEKHNLDIENGTLTIPEFIELVKGEFGSKTIARLEELIKDEDNFKKKSTTWFGRY